MNFIVHGAAGKEAGIPFGNLSIGHGGDGLHRLSLVIQFCTVGDGDMVPGLQFRELAHRSGIGALHAGFDVDNAAGHSLFSGLAHGPAHGNDAVTAVRGEDIPLGHLAAIAQGCGVSHAISHGSIVAESHVLAISCMGIHAQCDTGITGFRAIADSNRIVPGCRINADGYRVRSFGQCIDTGSQGIRSFSAVVIVVALCCIGGVDAVEMGLHLAEGISHSPAGDEPLVATLDLAGTNSTAPGFRIGGLFFICRIPQLHGAGLFILDIAMGIRDWNLGEIRTDIGSIGRSGQRFQLLHNHHVMVIYSIRHLHEAVIPGRIIVGFCNTLRSLGVIIICPIRISLPISPLVPFYLIAGGIACIMAKRDRTCRICRCLISNSH